MAVKEPTYRPTVKWKTCARSNDCIGVALHDGGPCLAHAEESSIDSALVRLKETGVFDGRGVRFSDSLLQRLLDYLPRDKGRRWLGRALFDQATFVGEARFNGITFRDDARFFYATFEGKASFQGAKFEADAWFEGARFRARAVFMVASFESLARFEDSFFRREVWFHRAIFKGGTWFDNAGFLDIVWLSEAVFETARDFGPILVCKELRLNGTLFKERIKLEAITSKLACKRVRFLAGAQLRIRWAEVILDDAEFAASSLLVGVPSIDTNFDEDEFSNTLTEIPSSMPKGQPWLASVHRADVGGLTISNIDLRACRFAGAHNLDRLGLENSRAFAVTPGLKAVATGWAWPPVWWWTRRQTLAEEHTWRATYERGIRKVGWHVDKPWRGITSGWVPNPPRPARERSRLGRHVTNTAGDWRRPHRLRRRIMLAWRIGAERAIRERARRQQAVGMRQQQAREIANLYRMLRKAREDAKDEPGAADFYYGEMEMRRQATPWFSVERAVLTLYWLVAGYALRAWRACAALALVLLLAAGQLAYLHGFADPKAVTFWAALRYSGRTAIGLLPKDQPALTPWGDVVQIAVRVIVPVLLGLAILSIRGRVKR